MARLVSCANAHCPETLTRIFTDSSYSWTVGPDWPNSGEIDIVEGANQAAENLMSLHTTKNCTVAGSGESGTLITNNCFVDAVDQPINSGCAVRSLPNVNSFGAGFNSGRGGVYAMEWTSKAIKIWFFPRGSIPASITTGRPDPTTFGLPAANFEGSCDIDSRFLHQKLVSPDRKVILWLFP